MDKQAHGLTEGETHQVQKMGRPTNRPWTDRQKRKKKRKKYYLEFPISIFSLYYLSHFEVMDDSGEDG